VRHFIIALALSALAPATALTQVSVTIEGVAAWQHRNEVQIPGDAGTRFRLDDVAGAGPAETFRVSLEWDFASRHGLRVVYAPLRLTEPGVLSDPVEFAGGTFAPGDVDATYQFNSPRVTYRYRIVDGDRGKLRVGFTALVRDAEIKLQQGAQSANDTNVGFVPLLHLSGDRLLTDRLGVAFDVDALAAPQGRAIDLGVRAQYAITDGWWIHAGYRTLEGGADNDEVYNFAWFSSAIAGLTVRF